MQVYDFQMPPFKSLAWVSDDARKKWESLFRKINLATVFTAVLGVTEGKWNYRCLRVHGWLYLKILALAKQYDIKYEAIPVGSDEYKGPVFYDINLFRQEGNVTIPKCCISNHSLRQQFYRKEFLWESAFATRSAKTSGNTIEIKEAVVMGGFWQQVLTNPTAHTLCSLDCQESLKLQEEHIEYMHTLGYDKEAELLQEIFSWPVEWSAAHGICELKTPVIKIAYDTDATDTTYRVRVLGSAYPEEGLEGLNFPYKRRKFLKITDSKSFKNGLAHGAKLKK